MTGANMENTTSLSTQIIQQSTEYFNEIRPHLLTFLTLILAAIAPIYAGTHASLSRPSTAAKTKKKNRSKRHASQADKRMESLTPIDALWFPVATGAMLVGLYYLIKWLQNPELLNKLLNYYLSLFGTFAIWQFVRDLLHVVTSFIFPTRYSYQSKIWTVDQSRTRFVSGTKPEVANTDIHSSPLPGRLSQLPLPSGLSRFIWKLRQTQTQPHALIEVFAKDFGTQVLPIDQSSILAAIVALGTVLYYNLVDRPWWLTNLFGFSFCYSSLQLLSPTTFWTGTLILTSLFFYDIYFVFYTPMMIEVATKLDIPVKLLIPKPSDSSQSSDKQALTLLGLGDIVLPGIMLGLALRFDLHMHYLRKQKRAKMDTNIEPHNLENRPEKSLTIMKAEYITATGNWGERFWANSEALKHEGGYFSKTYFTAGLLGYMVGMLVTESVMVIMKHGQPALLYLVPSVVGSLWMTALIRGEFAHMWVYTEAEESEIGKEKKNNTSKIDEKSTATNSVSLNNNEGKSSNSDQADSYSVNNPEVGSLDKQDKLETSQNKHKDSKDEVVDPKKLFYLSISLLDEPGSKIDDQDETDEKD